MEGMIIVSVKDLSSLLDEKIAKIKVQPIKVVETKTDRREMKKQEVANYWDVSLGTVDNWARDGFLHPMYLPGGHPVFDREEVMSLPRKKKTKR